ncbi:hypothetical protein CT19431_40081 [Cupriavidus taiwanensis]|nr:hypothetical protein CT19431_40081 [Cupriavidus taiwanensis]
MRGWNVSREVAVVPIDASQVNAHFLAFWIGSDASQQRLAKLEKGVAYTGINIEDLRMLPVSLPPLDEQIELVRRVQELFKLADELEVRRETAASAVGSMVTKILAKAFRGELVPQNSNDGAASELLARVLNKCSAAATDRRKVPNAIRSKPTMSIGIDKDTIRAAISKLEVDSFSFDELWAVVSGDYDSVKDILFELLQEPNPVVCQAFDNSVRAMKLRRVQS